MSETLTIHDVRAAVERIRDRRADDEAAHSMEDDLHQSVLRAIASGKCEDPVACAVEALRSLEIDFCRWYA